YAIDLGAFSPFLYAFQDREFILRIFEELSGARLLYNYIWIGGVWTDINDTQLRQIKKFCDEMDEKLKTYFTLVGQNKIFIDRTRNVGIMDTQMCFDYGAKWLR
ncbi:MAG: NADH-quinone oxidoreductase subunit D, partial [Flavobacteriaceae bacterium]|nr:NADH-quinone oxidoreductase subunit D [Flavobacteriaceae bacterium]